MEANIFSLNIHNETISIHEQFQAFIPNIFLINWKMKKRYLPTSPLPPIRLLCRQILLGKLLSKKFKKVSTKIHSPFSLQSISHSHSLFLCTVINLELNSQREFTSSSARRKMRFVYVKLIRYTVILIMLTKEISITYTDCLPTVALLQ